LASIKMRKKETQVYRPQGRVHTQRKDASVP